MLLGCFQVARTQVPAGYPQGYFRNPLNVPMLLSGNFGELRPNHYHMGFDLKTQAKENLPVYAAADGFVSRIKIEPFGFGRAIYVQHPNGYTTLYAHLNNFNTALENWVKQQQYQKQSWSVYLEVPPGLFPVNKGDFLANSGNTGGSQAPHLHFEIRETASDINVNPALFGFPIADNTRPTLLRLAIFDRRRSTYEQNPRLIAVKASAAGTYITSPSSITVSSPLISFATGAFDTQTGSSNRNGVFESRLLVDETSNVGFQMDRISYNDTRYLNAHVDYKTRSGKSIWLQHLSELPGYTNSVYRKTGGNGVIDISDGQPHNIRIETKDADGNTSILRFKVQYNGSPANSDNALPGKMFYPNMVDGFESGNCEFFLGERCLYDSVRIQYNQLAESDSLAVSPVHSIGAVYIPLHESFLVRLKPNRVLTPAESSRTVMKLTPGGVQKVEWQQGWAAARVRQFGNYRLMIDTEPPVITPVGFADGAILTKATRIVFTVKDNFGSFKNVQAELDGKWLRFTNDKGRTFIYRFDENCLAGPHMLKISAEDEAGNTSERVFRFMR
jgi:murein DD-endopeptidase MepM/ murein hydrolase activator NlpD